MRGWSAARWGGLAGLAVGLPFLGGGPVWDDHLLLVGEGAWLQSPDWWALWTEPVGGGPNGAGYYRPLALSWMALLAPLGMLGLHAASAGLHALSAWMIGQILEEGEATQEGAALGALLFAVHPLAGEVLGWASALPDASSVALGLGAVLLGRERPWLGGLLGLGALLCKETGLLFLPAGLLLGRLDRRSAGAWMASAVAAGALRAAAGVGGDWSLEGRLSLAPTALAWPLSSLMVPWPLSAVRDLRAAPAWSLALGLAVGLLACWRAWRHPPSRGALLLILGGPLLAIPPTLSGYLAAERYAYPALVGLAWMAAGLGRPPLAWMGLGLLPAALLVWRSEAWSSDLALFSAAERHLPCATAAHLHGVVLLREGRAAEAAEAFGRALSSEGALGVDQGLRIAALVQSGQAELALQEASGAPALDAEGLAWAARAAWMLGRREQALGMLHQLRRPEGWEGPSWVPAFAELLEQGG